ncbi:hypothetical protein AADG42_10790 [Ammonicoccus fulvus]|uniref:MOSC domain-containing protein n=1 Tax=Ammonicoccus fulvus TaxID=3138240 RepID=A0ABZ3FP15_9ACTN
MGKPVPLPPEGQLSGIVKHPVAGPVAVDPEGLAGDEQGDRRVHGGPEKAVHLFPPENYDLIAGAGLRSPTSCGPAYSGRTCPRPA